MDRGCSNGVYFGWKNYMPMGNTVGGMANVGGGWGVMWAGWLRCPQWKPRHISMPFVSEGRRSAQCISIMRADASTPSPLAHPALPFPPSPLHGLHDSGRADPSRPLVGPPSPGPHPRASPAPGWRHLPVRRVRSLTSSYFIHSFR